MVWHVYQINPIDFGWHHLKDLNETLADITSVHDAQFSNDLVIEKVRQFDADWKLAKEMTKKLGWEGDFREGPKVFWLPDAELDFLYGFAFKQDNNGTTFVVSPLPLPHLKSI